MRKFRADVSHAIDVQSKKPFCPEDMPAVEDGRAGRPLFAMLSPLPGLCCFNAKVSREQSMPQVLSVCIRQIDA